MENWIEAAQKQIEKHTPKDGFNVVAVDDFEPPGEGLYLVAHFATLPEAKSAAEQHSKLTGEVAYVYAPKA